MYHQRSQISHLRLRMDLHNLLNLQNVNGINQLDEDAIIQEIQSNPQAAERRYPFYLRRAACFPLHQAIMLRASYNIVHALCISYPRAVRIKYYYSDTALSLACWYGSSPEVVRLLAEEYPDALKIKVRNDKTVLHAACSFDASLDVVSLLVELWPDAVKDTGGSENCTPLHTALENYAPLEVILFLLQKWPEAVNISDILGDTPLDIANRRETKSDEVRMALRCVSQLCNDEIDYKSTETVEILKFFERNEWSEGITMFFDRYPVVAQSIEIDLKYMPQLLSIVGSHCKITTMMDILRNRHDLFMDTILKT